MNVKSKLNSNTSDIGEVLTATVSAQAAIVSNTTVGLDGEAVSSVVGHCLQEILHDRKQMPRLRHEATVSIVSLREYVAIESYLVQTGSYYILAGIILVASSTFDQPLLQAILETVNADFDVFQVIGLTESLCKAVYDHLGQITDRGPSMKALIVALCDLSKLMPRSEALYRSLQIEVQRHVHGAPITAWSPVEDPTADISEASDSIFVGDVEVAINTGTRLDDATLSNIFSAITSRLIQDWYTAFSLNSAFLRLLERLRELSEASFDTLLLKWIVGLAGQTVRPPLAAIVTPLVCARMLKFDDYLDCMAKYIQSLTDTAHRCDLSRETLCLLAVAHENFDLREGIQMTGHELRIRDRAYNYTYQRDDIVNSESPTVCYLLHESIANPHAHTQDSFDCTTCSLIQSPPIFAILRRVFLRNGIAVRKMRRAISTTSMHLTVLYVFRAMPFSHSNTKEDDQELEERLVSLRAAKLDDRDTTLSEVVRICKEANNFNICLCQLALAALLSSPSARINLQFSNLQYLAAVLGRECETQQYQSPHIYLSLLANLEGPIGQMASHHNLGVCNF
ncbi:RNA polymerase II mediator complex subunit [Agyrium rufum]|nr:RNA polymerase II mediator complex subunit [Agyrium rufum]